ncbi:ABC transporter substrate-binding protein, partial [Undibacterium sp.]|uniref:ABC transporter substrate-binding protein n=1 Tax=Undibacterium sp. TaxID=1914977 RepID=UPI00374CD2CB
MVLPHIPLIPHIPHIAHGVLAVTLSFGVVAANGAEPVKIGVVAPFSGVFSSYGKQIENGINVFLRENGDVVAGRKISIIYRDNAGPNPEGAKRAAQELVSIDKVDLLAGFAFTPDAMAAAPIAT